TLRGIGRAFDRQHILGVREEPRLREQDFGNFQVQERMRQIKDMRQRFGRFFYRFPEGESSADVYDRVTGFLDSLWRDIDWCRLHPPPPPPPPPTPSAHPAVAAATAAAARNAAVSAAAAAAAAVADSSAVGAASGPEAAGSPLLRGDRDEREERRGDGARGEQQEREERRVDSSHAHAETHADTHAPSPPLPPAPPSGATPSPAPPPPGATPPPHRKALNIVMVTHGLTTRVFLMRWFRWTVRQFEGLLNPGNCEIRVMEMGEGGKYSLAVRHSEYELFSWGLTPDMIADQHARMTRAVGDRKGRGTSGSPGWLSFFDHLETPSGLPLAASAAMTPAAVPAAVTPLAAAGAAAVAATGAAAVVAPAATAEGAAVAVAAATPAGAAGRAAAAAAETAGVTNRGAPGVAAAKSLQVSHGSSHLPQPVPLSLPTEISFSTNLVSGAAAAPAAGSVAPPAAGSAAGPGVVLAAGSADGFAPASTGASMDENGGMEEEQALICESGGLEEQELEGEGDGFAFMPPGACDEVGGDDSGSPTIGDTDGGLHKSVEWVTDGSRCEVEDSAGRILGWRREKWVAESNDTTPI
ncbi:unnamed protein product, partial [Closterium sp. NIES-53]